MKQPNFTPNELALIGDCVLQSIQTLRKAEESISIPEATQSIHTTIMRMNEILVKLAKEEYEEYYE